MFQKHNKAKREEKLERRSKKNKKNTKNQAPKEQLIEKVMSQLAHDAVPVRRIEIEEEEKEETALTPTEMSDRVLMIKDQVDEIAIRTFLEDLESFDKMTLITITNGLLTRD